MKRCFFTISLIAMSLGHSSAFAEEVTEGWDGTIEFSAANATGNSENTTIGVGLDSRNKQGRYTHNVDAYANYAESDGTEQQNNFGVAYQLDLDLSDVSYGFGRISYEQDEFSGFDYRVFLGAGLGRFLIQNNVRVWKVEAGPGVRFTRIEEPVPLPPGFEDEETEVSAFANSEFDWTIREGVLFEHNLAATYADSSSTISTLFALSTKLTENLSSKVSYQVDFETDPPLGREDTDTLLKASLLLGF